MAENVVKVAVRVPERIREALRALALEREFAEGRPVAPGQVVADLVMREAATVRVRPEIWQALRSLAEQRALTWGGRPLVVVASTAKTPRRVDAD